MSTTSQALSYLWIAYFKDGSKIEQPADDRYSKHVDDAEWNPTAFRDVHERLSEVVAFELVNQINNNLVYGVNLEIGVFMAGDHRFSLEDHLDPLTDRKLIFFRDMLQHEVITKEGSTVHEPYVFQYKLGYEGKNPKGENVKCIVYVEA